MNNQKPLKRFNRPVRIDVLLQRYWERLLEKRLAELNKEIFE
ncbi:hypothetical protein [Lonepinella koalarum]|nr:hypothetical protein [Lonepinella koalarum]